MRDYNKRDEVTVAINATKEVVNVTFFIKRFTILKV